MSGWLAMHWLAWLASSHAQCLTFGNAYAQSAYALPKRATAAITAGSAVYLPPPRRLRALPTRRCRAPDPLSPCLPVLSCTPPGLPESVSKLKQALVRGYAVAAMSSADRSTGGGGRCWKARGRGQKGGVLDPPHSLLAASTSLANRQHPTQAHITAHCGLRAPCG